MLYFESLFFKMDPDGDGVITFDEARQLLVFTALTLTPEEVEERLVVADASGSGKLGRGEFIDLCMSSLWEVPLEQLEMAASNFAEHSAMKLRRTTAKYRRMANRIDRWCRTWIPIMYLSALIVIYTLEIDDNYDDPATEMYHMFGNVGSGASIARIKSCTLSEYGEPAGMV